MISDHRSFFPDASYTPLAAYFVPLGAFALHPHALEAPPEVFAWLASRTLRQYPQSLYMLRRIHSQQSLIQVYVQHRTTYTPLPIANKLGRHPGA